MNALRLEVFDMPGTSQTRSGMMLDPSAIEDIRMQAYEQGYTAGWEDAAAAEVGDQSRIKADFARNLQSLGFTFQEARMHVIGAVRPLIEEIVCHLLPEIARDALASTVLETLMPMANDLANGPVTIVLNPVSRAAVEALLVQETGLPLTIIEEPTLGEGQVYLQLGVLETQINLDRATADIAAAVHNFFDIREKDQRYG